MDKYNNFDWLQYISNYADLDHLNTRQKAWKHYVLFGKSEGRTFQEPINLNVHEPINVPGPINEPVPINIHEHKIEDKFISLNVSKTILVTVSDDRSGRKGGLYSITQDKVLDFIKKINIGITDTLFVKWEDIVNSPFYSTNKIILDKTEPDINGRCYKPYVILEALKKINENDFLIYNDISPEIWNNCFTNFSKNDYNLEVIKKLCSDNGGILTSLVIWEPYNDSVYGYHTHEFFTLNRCINAMGLRDYIQSLQHASGMIVLQKSKKTIKFVEEWLKWNLTNECASLSDFDNLDYSYWHAEENVKIGHRHDQSISALLINKMNGNYVLPVQSNNFHTYNFLQFCRKNYKYKFINSNYMYKTPSKYIIKPTCENNIWSYKKILRN